MKLLISSLFALFLVFVIPYPKTRISYYDEPSRVLATTYYVSPTGNDAADGKTQATAWRTLNKVSTFAFATGDNILFQRGGKWSGQTLTVPRSNLNFGAYGSGELPLISGFAQVTGWVPTGSGKYYCSFSSSDSMFSLVEINGNLQQMARYPDYDDAAKGYLQYDTIRLRTGAGAGSPDSIRIKGTVSGDWTGKRIVLRPNDWRLENCTVTRDSADVLTFKNYEYRIGYGTTAKLEPTKDNHGYFFVDDTSFLNKFGEFKLQKNLSRLYVYFGANDPNSYLVRASTVNILFNIGNKTNITVKDIAFEGATWAAIAGTTTPGNLIQGVKINNCNTGIMFYRLYSSIIDNCLITNCLQNGIYVRSVTYPYTNVTITNNTLKWIGMFPGMGSKNQDGDYCGIYAVVRSNNTVQYNNVFAAGIDAIKWQGSNVDVGYNYIDSFCFVGQDHAAVYTFHDPSDTAYFDNRNIHDNIIRNAIGAPDGAGNVKRANGIYCDGYSSNVSIYRNVMDSIKRSAVNLNMESNVRVYENVVLLQDDNSRCIGVQNNGAAFGPVRDFYSRRNVFYLTKTNQSFFYFTIPASGLGGGDIQDTLRAIGTSDSNWANRVSTLQYRVEYYNPNFNLGEFNWGLWTGFSNWDLNNVETPTYGLDSVKLVYNRNRSARDISIPAGNWQDVKTGTVYNGKMLLQPFAGAILTYVGTYTPPPVPAVKSVIKKRRFVNQ